MPRPLIVLLGFFLAMPLGRAAESQASWPSDIQAVLDQHCVKCHGPLEQKSGLELDTLEAVLKGSEDGPVLKPGKPDESLLIAALEPGADPHMPPKKQLGKEDVTKLRAWVASLSEQPAPVASKLTPAPTKVPAEPSAAIDYFLAAAWQERGVTPAPLCDDRTFVRRIYLDLAGRIPTQDEVTAFLFDAAPRKREALVDRLLVSDEYARTYREIWDTLLMGRGAGRRDQRRKDNGWYAFLEGAFKQNRPWNEVVRAIIAARPERPEDKGAQWFLYERRNEHQRMAEAVAPVIYGTRIDCAQCHDHPLAREIKQGHYWGLVAAFNRSKNVEKGPPSVAEAAVGGFINFTNLKKESQPAVITMLTGRTIDESRPQAGSKEEDTPDGYIDPAAPVKVPKFSRRAALAEAATKDNPLLARSFVNHTWAILMGRGIVHPVDEMNSKNKPSHPELLNWLSADFAAHGYDMRRLVRAIVLSRGYQLSIWSGEKAPAPETFAAAAERPLIGEAIARSARIASGRPGDDDGLRKAAVEYFPDVLPRVVRSTVQQAMFLANNEQVSALFKADAGTVAERLGALPTPEARVREAFRIALIREPDAADLAKGVEFLTAYPDKPAEAVGQLLWALVTGPEFLTNH
ncbi:DUF1549 domain-containing protein [Verrucomicrobiota bacterium sgz303538]